MCADTAKSLMQEFSDHPSQMSKGLRSSIQYGFALDAAKVREAREIARLARDEVEKLFGDCRLLITPSALGEAPGSETTGDPLLNRVWTLLHLPCVNLPIGLGPNGLPLSVQVVARAYDEAALLGGAGWIEMVITDSL